MVRFSTLPLDGGTVKQAIPKREYLPEIISKSRLSHIEAERRLVRYDQLVKRANIYYACWMVLFSLLSFCFPEFQLVSFLAIALAVMLTIVTVFASLQDYGSRAFEMRSSYLEMQKLWLELDSVPEDEDIDKRADRIGEAYISVLMRTENHTTTDFVTSCFKQVEIESDLPKDELGDGRKPLERFRSRWLEVFVYGCPIMLIALTSIIYTAVEHACL